MNKMNIKGLLIDLDGVIYNDTQLVSGAAETIQYLQQKNISFRFITNTTMKSRATLQKKLSGFGIEVPENNIFSAAYAAAQYIRNQGKTKCHLLIDEDAQKEYNDLDLISDKPDYVVVGDLGEKITFDKLNTAFQKLFEGAELIALQKNRFWLSDKGYALDAGAFVALFEYAANKDSILIGKPSKVFFETALNDLGCTTNKVLMIGDDIESDIKGAQSIGIKGVLVQTGKFLPNDLEREDITPWKTISSISEIMDIV
jgi:HAD superfamily hydrolase (TIGR01458 family)